MVTFLKEGITFRPELGKRVAAFLQLADQAADALVGLAEFGAFFCEFIFERPELRALAGDDGVGDVSLGFEVAVEIGVFLAHHLEIRLENRVASEGLGVGAAALAERHSHGFAFLLKSGDALVERPHFVFNRPRRELGPERLDVGFRRVELGLDGIALAGDVADTGGVAR